ncbi:PREDICTED: TRAF3-interacting protein 1-like isoform X2 [Priapulus caudatus]|uniref:TRAF3-interacting protein 1-like isoform X2 n=1 Tax=Priapulus caudatus TaxID=37621 RepID=A0ABM1ECI1_PRICU|nr:PREDICTED: TRAF3-interacting protein 1-like isoform X2 [Priapulus caudatus]
MDEDVIKRTQDTLGKIVKKPPMTDKLLSKPPFRFLHDILTAVIKTTGFMKGVYAEDEMNSENVKDKEAKMSFLQKAIDVVAFTTGKSLSVKTSKIVAGHEPEKTNEFLQALAEAINSGVDSTNAVEKVINGEKPSGTTKNEEKKKKKEKDKLKDPKDDEKPREKSRDKLKTKERHGSKERVDEKERSKDRHKDKERSKHKDKEKDREKKKHREAGSKEHVKESNSEVKVNGTKEKVKKEVKADGSEEKIKEKKRRPREKDRDRDKEKKTHKREKEEKTRVGENVPQTPALPVEERPPVNGEVGFENEAPRPGTAKGGRKKRTTEGAIVEEQPVGPSRQRSAMKATRESSAVPQNDEEDIVPQQVLSRRPARPSSARPPPPRIARADEPEEVTAAVGVGRVENLIVDDGKAGEEEDDDNFMVEETAEAPEPDVAPVVAAADEEDDGQHGQLMQKILDVKKQEEEKASSLPTRIEREKPGLSEAARRKERELVAKEIERFRSSIQALTRSANPLGKVMDYIQEDMDSMQKELDMWAEENKAHRLALKQEQSITETQVEPLKMQLVDLDGQINDILDRISGVKANIMRSDEKIQKMVGTR